MAVESRLRPAGARDGSLRRDEGTHAAAENLAGQLQVRAIQRSRLLVAAVGAVVESGWESASIARITDRAGVSRRTFYELFESRDDCLVAVLESATAKIASEVAAADLGGLSWRQRVHGGLWTVLCFFDREPALARVCLLESRRGGDVALEYRQLVIDDLVRIVDQGRGESSRAASVAELTAHGVVGGVMEVLYSQLLRAPGEPLRGLLGQLMGMIVLPYLGVAASQREQRRVVPPTDVSLGYPSGGASISSGGSDVLATLPMRLTYRTANVLRALEESPGQSNRQVADLVGIADQGQISKLLARLARLGLATNRTGVNVGERNNWTLTPAGSQVTRSIKSYTTQEIHEAGQEIKGGAQHAH